ncbi:DMT family transporter [Nocardia sp. MH4]|uniref:DMT family transporter n=1 Tax=Nocardia sp. MH4 TaxID=1768677 RepID=UPI001C4F29DC|nr:DMT family transporter [Nocardia sp. MH4]
MMPTSVGLFVTGQMFASLALDVGGLLGVEPRPLGPGMLLGAAVLLAGIVVVIRSQLTGGRGQTSARAQVGWIALGLGAGAALPVQGATNAALRRALDDPFVTGLWSFVVATVTIAVALAVVVVTGRTPRPRLAPLRTVPWWGRLGGVAAATYVTVIPQIGAATTIALTVTGQQLVSAAIDHRGWCQLPSKPVTSARWPGSLR